MDIPVRKASFVEERGVATWYGRVSHGRRTASGRGFNMNELTAAHHWLPFGTRVRVTLQSTGQQVVVVITDRLAAARRVIATCQSRRLAKWACSSRASAASR